jgi:exodeoxyribonuclease VII large subunit
VEQVSFDLGELAKPERTRSVRELTSGLRDAVRAAFPAEVWVRGEVQGLRRSPNGHTYFSLVEKTGRGDTVQASVDVMLWRDDRGPVDKAIRSVPGAELGDDVEVRLRGRLDVYVPQGRVRLRMTAIDPEFTVGNIAVARARTLASLRRDGLVDRNARQVLAPVPLRVGLVTSRGSAAFHDFVEELAASGLAFRVAVVDVRVQGANASRRIVYGLRQLAMRDLDVVVLARGGGSRTDLAPFDSEVVARAIAAMPVPVVCGVGHEIDRSVADEVAHTSCKTPTACAQLLVGEVQAFVARVDVATSQLIVRSRAQTATASRDVELAAERVVTRSRARTATAARAIEGAARQLRRSVPTALARERAQTARHQRRAEELARLRVREASRRLEDCSRRVGELGRARLREAGLVLDRSAGIVRALDPVRVLERGYSITRDDTGTIVRRIDDVVVGARVQVQVADGGFRARVEDARSAAGEPSRAGANGDEGGDDR